jgi:hypothetical protein
MSARRSRQRLPTLPLKAVYTVGELAAAIGISRVRIARILRVCDVKVFAKGRSVYIPLSEIREKLEPIWQGILEAQRVLEGNVE